MITTTRRVGWLFMILLFLSCARHESPSNDEMVVGDEDSVLIDAGADDDLLFDGDSDESPDSDDFWDFRISLAQNNLLAGIVPTDDGGFIVAVKMEDNFPGLNGAFLARYNSDFSERWIYWWENGVSPVGLTYGQDQSEVIVSGRGDGMYLARFNAQEGILLWEQLWQHEAGDDPGDALNMLNNHVVGHDGLFVLGLWQGSIDGHMTYPQAYIGKIDFEGNLLWGKTYGDGNAGTAAIDSEGNLYATGYMTDKVEYVSSVLPFLMKLDSNGNVIWLTKWEKEYENLWSWGLDVLVDEHDDIYVISQVPLLQDGIRAMVRKYTKNGALLWEYHSAATFYAERVYGLFLKDRYLLLFGAASAAGSFASPLLLALDADSGQRIEKRLLPVNDGGTTGKRATALGVIERVQGLLLFADEERTTTFTEEDTWSDIVFKRIPYFYEGPPAYHDTPCSDEILKTRQFGTESEDIPIAVAYAPDGTIIIVGNTEGIFPGNASHGLGDIFVTKRKEDGTPLWTKQFGTSDNDIAAAVVVDNEGNLYVTGHTYGHFAHPWWRHRDPDVFLAKISPDGTVAWIEQMRTDDEDYATALAVTGAGNILMYGYTRGSLDGLPKDETECYDKVNSDLFLAEWTPEGEMVWLKQWGGDKDDMSAGMTLDAEGNIFITGYTQSALEGNIIIEDNLYFGEHFPGAFASKRTPAGEKIWTKVWQRENGSLDIEANRTDEGKEIAVRSDGTVIVAGIGRGIFSNGTAEESPCSPAPSSACRDVFITTLSSDGELWAHQWIGTLWFEAVQDMVLHNDTVTIVGSTEDAMDGQTYRGWTDCFVTTLGETPKTEQFGTPGEDICRAAAWDEKTSSLLIVGETRSTFSGCTNAGNSDGFVVKVPM